MKFKWVILFSLIPLLSRSQSNSTDSLKKVLPFLKDSSRIDCLNKLSAEYYKNALAETYYNVQTDTASSFASEAYREAVIIHYNKGIAEALQNLGEIARDRGDFLTAENYFHQAIHLFEQIHAWKNLAGQT